MIPKAQILEREKRWTLIAGIASVMGVAVILATFGSSSASVRAASGLAAELRSLEGDHASLWAASFGQFIGWSLLAVPLVFLFKAAAARSPRVRPALIGLVIIAPVLLGAGSLISAGSIIEAATDFKSVDQARIDQCVTGKAAGDSGSAEDSATTGTTGATGSTGSPGASGATGPASSDGATGEAGTAKNREATGVSAADREEFQTECEDEEAREVRGATSLAPLETGIGLAGLFGFTISVVYVSLWGMRTGLLSRFWGSLGVALGAVFAFFTLFTLIWFIYVGLLLAGWVPGGRPPAWAAGEARPWLKPGRQDADDDVIEGTADEIDPSAGELDFGESDWTADPDGPDEGPGGERRKRKKRNG